MHYLHFPMLKIVLTLNTMIDRKNEKHGEKLDYHTKQPMLK